jgi:hypothetical protein
MLSPRVQHLVQEAAELSSDDLAALIDAIQRLPRTERLDHERHAVIAERVRRVQAGVAATLSVDDVEQSIRTELDF